MPDWEQIVRKNLRVLGVCSPEVTEEIAGHLEDSYEALLRDGLPADVALHRTMSQIEGRRKSWLVLRFLQEGLMTGFIRKVALPGLVTSAASWLVSWALMLAHIQPKIILMPRGQLQLCLVLSPWWWGLLPFCGALGALLSQRNGGSRLQRIVASSAPGAIIGVFLLLMFAVVFTFSGFVNREWWDSAHWEGLGLLLLSFSIIPAAFLLLGAGVAEVSTKKFERLAQ